MNYGFVIDQSMCIGCHACTVACKSEHDVPLGVYRTHVKYVEKGTFPDTRRTFSIHRCNHCEDAPCTTICPTSALHTRDDGVVDFDNRRCIGCRACMQACPYDALYIDPRTHTAAKCNYCAHRLDGGYEPACVIVCPVEAIVSGDLDDPTSKVAGLAAREKVSVRKPEKGTSPNVYYIGAEQASLSAAAAPREADYTWTAQRAGVGHHAAGGRELRPDEKQNLLLKLATTAAGRSGEPVDGRAIGAVERALEEESRRAARRAYDAPSKGVLWGWEVAGYLWTKAIATGTFLMASVAYLAAGLSGGEITAALVVSLLFTLLTTALLVKDLDRPDRFLYVVLRPNWSSWLVRGGYLLGGFGALVTIALIASLAGAVAFAAPMIWAGMVLAALTAVYTAFLFAQARGRDLWQSPLTSVRMLVQCALAGTAVMWLISGEPFLGEALFFGVLANMTLIYLELFAPHATVDASRAAALIWRGPYSLWFHTGMILGNMAPVAAYLLFGYPPALLVLLGLLLTEFVWIRVPQLIALD